MCNWYCLFWRMQYLWVYLSTLKPNSTNRVQNYIYNQLNTVYLSFHHYQILISQPFFFLATNTHNIPNKNVIDLWKVVYFHRIQFYSDYFDCVHLAASITNECDICKTTALVANPRDFSHKINHLTPRISDVLCLHVSITSWGWQNHHPSVYVK